MDNNFEIRNKYCQHENCLSNHRQICSMTKPKNRVKRIHYKIINNCCMRETLTEPNHKFKSI